MPEAMYDSGAAQPERKTTEIERCLTASEDINTQIYNAASRLGQLADKLSGAVPTDVSRGQDAENPSSLIGTLQYMQGRQREGIARILTEIERLEDAI